MKSIIILVPEGENNLSSIAGSYEILNKANNYWAEKEKRNTYTIQLVGVSNEVELQNGLFSIKPHLDISDCKDCNLIIIPSMNHNYETVVKANELLVAWIANQYKKGAEIAAICTGSFLLASTGLLDGKDCSTHWAAAENFRKMFPKVNLKPDQLITDYNGIYTNGGAYSFLNLMVYIIEKYFDRETAIYCSKVFQIEIDRNSQSVFSIFSGQKTHNDEVVKEAQRFIESKIEEKISVEQLSAFYSLGRRTFDRRFIKATGNTPIEYSQRVKIESAKKTLETSRKTINEVMFEVGYSDVKAFREVFRKITGMTPIEYKSRYNKD
jgi:transcriptional regulator GlxA family with amidase domain